MNIPEAFAKAYRLLERVTPLPVDCGQLCGGRCCVEWEEGVGMYLLPGEECMYSGKEDWLTWSKHSADEYEFCPSWTGDITFVMCQGRCPRHHRPFACRTFPLIPHLSAEGELSMVFDPNGVLICPLVQLSDMAVLDAHFISACREAWSLLMEASPLILDDVRFESRRRDGLQDDDGKLRQLLGGVRDTRGGSLC